MVSDDKDVRLSELIFQRGKLKVVKELIDNPEKEYSIKQLSEESDVSYDLTHRFTQKLAALGILSRRKIGGAVLLQLNQESPYVQTLQRLVRIDAQPLIDTAQAYAEKLCEKEAVKTVIVFGSVARGKPGTDSDIDILVLVEENQEEVERYANKIASRYEREEKITFTPIVETWTEFKEDLETESPFATEIRRDGIILTGDTPW